MLLVGSYELNIGRGGVVAVMGYTVSQTVPLDVTHVWFSGD